LGLGGRQDGVFVLIKLLTSSLPHTLDTTVGSPRVFCRSDRWVSHSHRNDRPCLQIQSWLRECARSLRNWGEPLVERRRCRELVPSCQTSDSRVPRVPPQARRSAV